MRLMGRLSHALVFVLAAAVGMASVADCLPSASMTPSQMACCVAVDHDCDEVGTDTSCCPPGSRDTTQALTLAAAKGQGVPVVTVMSAGDWCSAARPSSWRAPLEAFSRRILKLPKRPTYLLVSTLLI